MSTDIERRPDAPVPAVVQDNPISGWADALMSWAAAAQKAHDIASILCETSFVPKSMQHRPGEVTGAILTGLELGKPIMWALSNIDIVEGSPAIRAKGMRGLLKRHGHDIWVEETSATRAIVCARHKGSTHVERSVWTLDRAKKAELLGKKNWRLYPQDMLLNRATAEAARLAAPDVLIGGGYTVEELDGDGPGGAPDDVQPQQETKPAPKKRTAQRAKPAPTVAPEALPSDMPAPDDARPTVVSEAQAVETMEAAGFEVVDVIDTMQPPSEEPADSDPLDGEVLAETCDITMPHDMGKPAPAGCPPNCPTRIAAERELAASVGGEAGQPELMTDAQRKRMNVEMRRVGLVLRDERLAFAAHVVGRPVETSSELTVNEATEVITALIAEGLDNVRTKYGDDSEGDDDGDGE